MQSLRQPCNHWLIKVPPLLVGIYSTEYICLARGEKKKYNVPHDSSLPSFTARMVNAEGFEMPTLWQSSALLLSNDL